MVIVHRAKEVQRVWGEYVAIQTCTFQKSIDPEYGNRGQVGTFTQDWVHYNEDADIYPGWSDKERTDTVTLFSIWLLCTCKRLFLNVQVKAV
jgi:hypothetical protein